MKQEETILRRIQNNKETIEKFRADKSLDRVAVKRAIFTLQEVNRNLKWVLK